MFPEKEKMHCTMARPWAVVMLAVFVASLSVGATPRSTSARSHLLTRAVPKILRLRGSGPVAHDVEDEQDGNSRSSSGVGTARQNAWESQEGEGKVLTEDLQADAANIASLEEQWQKAARRAEAHARQVKAQAAKEVAEEMLAKNSPNSEIGEELDILHAQKLQALRAQNRTKELDYEFEIIEGDDHALQGISQDSSRSGVEPEGWRGVEDYLGADVGVESESIADPGADAGRKRPREARPPEAGVSKNTTNPPSLRSNAGSLRTGDGLNAFRAALDSEEAAGQRRWLGDGEDSDGSWPCSECGRDECDIRSAYWATAGEQPCHNPRLFFVPKKKQNGLYSCMPVCREDRSEEGSEESEGMPSTDDFIDGQSRPWPEVAVGEEAGMSEEKQAGGYKFQSCFSLLQQVEPSCTPGNLGTERRCWVFIGGVVGGQDGLEGRREAERIQHFVPSTVAGVEGVTYVCCTIRDPRIPRPRPNQARACGGAGDTVAVAGPQGAEVAVSSKTPTSVPRLQDGEDEESDVVEAREDAAQAWLSSLGVPAATALIDGRGERADADLTLGGKGDGQGVAAVQPGSDPAEAIGGLEGGGGLDVSDSSSANPDEVLALGQRGRGTGAWSGQGSPGNVESVRACKHAATHVGYVLVQANSSAAAQSLLRCLSERYAQVQVKATDTPPDTPGETAAGPSNGQPVTAARMRRGAKQAMNCSLGYSGSVVLWKAIRACRSRPQLIELLLPFLSSSSSPLLRSPTVSPASSALVAASLSAGAHGDQGDGGSRRLETCATDWATGQAGSKAAAAAQDALKGMRLDGETCALALRKMLALPPFPKIKRGESWHAKRRKARRDGPQMPDLVDRDWRPRDAVLLRQQVVVAALLQRVLDVSKMTRTFALASVLHVIEHLEERYLALPGGFDWRYPRHRPPTADEQACGCGQDSWGEARVPAGEGFREYGWPGLVYRVWQRLSSMRHGSVFECFQQISVQMTSRYKLRYRGQRRGELSQGHEVGWRERRRLDRYTASPFVPGRLLAGDDVVKGSYMARTGGAKDLRLWLARCRGVPEHALPHRRAPVCDETLRKRARALDREILRREACNFRQQMMDHFHTTNRSLALEKARAAGLVLPSKAVLQGMGKVRTPLEGFWINEYKVPGPNDAPTFFNDLNADVEKWRPDWDYTLGLADPLFTRWKYHDSLPPHTEPEHAVHRPCGLARTSFSHVQRMLGLQRLGLPYLNCVGGVRVPDANTTQALLAAVLQPATSQPLARSTPSVKGSSPKSTRESSKMPDVSRTVNPEAWCEWLMRRHARFARRRHVADSYLSSQEELDEKQQASTEAEGTDDAGANMGRRPRQESESCRYAVPEMPGWEVHHQGVDEWQRQLRRDKIAEHERNARLANVSLTAEVRELLPLLGRRTDTMPGHASRLPRDEPRLTAAGFERELEILRTGDVDRLRGGSGDARHGGDGCGRRGGGRGWEGDEDDRRRRSCERISKMEQEWAEQARAAGTYDQFFMDSDEWDDKTRRVMDALSDYQRPLYKLPKAERQALAQDMADVVRGLSIPEWVVMSAISKHHRRRARTAEAAAEAAYQQRLASICAPAGGRACNSTGDADKQPSDEHDDGAGTRWLMTDLPHDPAGTAGDSGWPAPVDTAVAPPWLGFAQYDWEARTWGPEMPRDAEPAPSDHDAELTDEALHALVRNEKLLLAVQALDFDAVEQLVAAGADVDFYDGEFSKCCALHFAAAQDDGEMVHTLLALGANVSVADGSYSTPLHRAAASGLADNVAVLVAAGANVNALDAQGRSPLHLAAGWGHASMVRQLVELGANVSLATALGDTALHAAAAWGRLDAAEALLELGAAPSASNEMFVSPLDLAREYNYSALADRLLLAGAVDVDQTRARWDHLWSLLEDAAESGALGESLQAGFNSSHVRDDMKAIHARLEQLKNETGPLAEYLRWCDDHMQMVSEMHVPDPPDPDDDHLLEELQGAGGGRRRARRPVALKTEPAEDAMNEEERENAKRERERITTLKSTDPALAAFFAMKRAEEALDKRRKRTVGAKRRIGGQREGDHVGKEGEREVETKGKPALSQSTEFLRDSRFSLL